MDVHSRSSTKDKTLLKEILYPISGRIMKVARIAGIQYNVTIKGVWKTI